MVIAVTNRILCKDEFIDRIEKLACAGVDKIILREKDLEVNDYIELADQCEKKCRNHNCEFLLNTHYKIAADYQSKTVHLPYAVFEQEKENIKNMQRDQKIKFGVSVHSVEEAQKAQEWGARYLIAGHIYDTNCKKGLAGRGIAFLESICKNVEIPVYAIGGITSQNAGTVTAAGASGICIMSEAMRCEDISGMINGLTR